MINQLGLFLTALWGQSPFYRLANDQNNLCLGAGICGTDSSGNVVAKNQTELSNPLTGSLKGVADTLLTVAGAVTVIIIIIAGIRYITSGGDASQVKQAKDTLLYAIGGLIIVILAYAIVNFVTTNIH